MHFVRFTYMKIAKLSFPISTAWFMLKLNENEKPCGQRCGWQDELETKKRVKRYSSQ